MPVVVFANPKGGTGKTTSALLLATEISRKLPVTIIDADPNHPITDWAQLPGKPSNVHVVSGATEETILDQIDAATCSTPFVIVDLEGTASMVVVYAISRAHLVLIPLQARQLDGKQAARAIGLVKRQEKAFGRKIPHAVVYTRTSAAIRSRALRVIDAQLRLHGVTVLQTELNERSAFDAFIAYGGIVDTLNPTEVSNIENASMNARAYTAEVIAFLRQHRENPNQPMMEMEI